MAKTSQGWNIDAKKAKATLNTSSIFGDLQEINAKKFNDIELGENFKLGRFEVFKGTKNHEENFIVVELSGEVYSGYASGTGNQLITLAGMAIEAEQDGVSETEKKVVSEVATGLVVVFEKRKAAKGNYISMSIAD